jgi:FkbM family methyltransferase
MGLKQRAGVLLHHAWERARVPPHARLMGDLMRDLQLEWLVDVGANRGQFGTLMRRAGFERRIVSLEPVADAYASLQEVAAADPLWTVEQRAVGATPGRQVIHVAGNSVSSSLLPMGERHLELSSESAYTRDEEVEVTTVEAVVAAHGIDASRSMLKADVQGFESAVLDGAGPELERFAMLELELSLLELYEGQELLPELITRVTEAGFVLWTFFPAYIDKVNKRMWWADGLFVRADLAERYPHRSRDV